MPGQHALQDAYMPTGRHRIPDSACTNERPRASSDAPHGVISSFMPDNIPHKGTDKRRSLEGEDSCIGKGRPRGMTGIDGQPRIGNACPRHREKAPPAPALQAATGPIDGNAAAEPLRRASEAPPAGDL